MSRWIFNVGDTVFTVTRGEIRRGHILGMFVFEGMRHFVIHDERAGYGYYIHTDARPDKRQVFTPKRGLNQEM